MEGRFRRIFGDRRPLIAMAHLPALPGTPLHDAEQGVDGIVEWVRRDLEILLAHPFDAILFCNENDRPWCLQAKPADVAVMTRVVTELAPRGHQRGDEAYGGVGRAEVVTLERGRVEQLRVRVHDHGREHLVGPEVDVDALRGVEEPGDAAVEPVVRRRREHE